MNYYNENDPRNVAWLKELIKSNLIAPGEVDSRSIVDVRAGDLKGFCQWHFFAGIGGWSYALRLAGWPDSKPVWTGSCPCQPFSCAGQGLGEADERHLWPYFRNLIGECQAPIAFGEQVASPDGLKWLAGVRADMEAAGYGFGAVDLCAAGIQTPHIRQRIYWVADSESEGRSGMESKLESEIRERARLGGRSSTFRLGEPNGTGRDARESAGEDAGHGSAVESAGDTSGLEHAINAGLEGQPGHGNNGDQSGRFNSEPNRSIAEAGGVERMGDAKTNGCEVRARLHSELRRSGFSEGCQPSAWSDFDVLHMRDEKSRRVESGTFPLAPRLPRGVVPSCDISPAYAQTTSEERVARLKGYGNAIVPQLAAEFIKAYLEI